MDSKILHKKIRKNVFETNSSSTHSITINSNSPMYIKCLPNCFNEDQSKNGLIITELGNNTEFGWSRHKHFKWQEKAIYCYLLACYSNSQQKLDNLIEVIKEYSNADFAYFLINNPRKYSESKITNLYNGLNEYCSFISSVITNSDLAYAYIDHQSAPGENDFDQLLDNKQDIKDFIFSQYSFIETGNDNDESSRPEHAYQIVRV